MQIFISYRSTDRALVNELVSDLTDMEHSVWYDQELEGGQVWWDKILEAIRQCDVVLFALTPKALDSRPCQLEYTYANALNRHIIPVLLDTGVNTRLLPNILQERQIVDYVNRDKASFKSLSTALRNLPPAPPLPDPLPTPPATPISPLAAIRTQIDTPMLTYEQQIAAVHQLKGYLTDPENAADARDLLTRLSQHPTLLAGVYREIEQVMSAPAPSPAAPVSNPAPVAQAKPQQIAPSELPQGAQRFRASKSLGREITADLIEGWITVAPGTLTFEPSEPSKKGQPPDKHYLTLPLHDIVSVKKANNFLVYPVVRIATGDGTEYDFSLTDDAGSFGDRDKFIRLVEQMRAEND
jgi:hypothetical protein